MLDHYILYYYECENYNLTSLMNFFKDLIVIRSQPFDNLTLDTNLFLYKIMLNFVFVDIR